MPAIQLFSTPFSGHCHRVTLLLNMLNLPFEVKDAPADVRQSAEFLRLNPLGQIPVLVDDGHAITDSNAILVYLVKRYAPDSHWLSEDPLKAAEVQKWLSRVAGEVRFGPASARMVKQFSAPESLESALAVTAKFLPQLELHVETHEFLATERATIADLACYAYVATAPEGGISLAQYPAIQRWLRRIESLPGFTPLPALPLPEDKK
ncbi:glutathione S-transferase family protein [Rahnella inusitata]|uniref:glutathione S-transferase family protein n=1 Tax=Rahnella inusitata TaxID=58169 RepID=UPI0039AF726F